MKTILQSLSTSSASKQQALHHASRRAFLTILLGIIICAQAQAVNRTWDNGGGDGLWSNPLNWSGNVVPTAADVVLFDATSANSCTVDVNPTIQQLNLTAAYLGTVYLGTQTLKVTQKFSVASAGQLDAGTSLVQLDGTISVNALATVYRLELMGNGEVTFFQDLNVSDDLTITQVATMGNFRKINVSGDVWANDTNGWGTTFNQSAVTVNLVGAADQHIGGTSGLVNFLNIDKSAGNVLLDANLQVDNILSGTAQANMVNAGGLLRLTNTSVGYLGSVEDVELFGNGAITFSQDLNVSDDLTITQVATMGNFKKINVKGDVLANDANGWGTNFNQSAVTVRHWLRLPVWQQERIP